jgi:hypothetical protein
VVFVVLLPLSALCKENGVLIPVLLLVVEITAFDYKLLSRINRIRLGTIGIVTVAIPGMLFLAAVVLRDPRLMGGYEVRDFDMSERLLTQGRVLWYYISMALFPSNSSLGLYHDDIVNSTGILQPITTLLAWGGHIGMLAISIALKRRVPAVTFGILWFYGGHLLESTVLPLEMVHEHRNYLPIFGLIFAVCFLVVDFIRTESFRRVIMVAVASFTLLMAIVTFLRAEQWGDSLSHAVHEVENHPNSERSQLQLGRMFMLMMIDEPRREYYEAAKEALEKSVQLSKVSVTAHFSLIQLGFLIKQPVDPLIVDAAARVLSNGPVPPSVAGAFRALVDCQMFAYCALSDAEIIRLANAALTNPRAYPNVTTQIAIYLTQYQIDKMGDGNLAVLTLQKAIERDPNSAALHLTAGRVFRVVGDFERSLRSLEQATNVDSVGTYRTAIGEEKSKLSRDIEKSRG